MNVSRKVVERKKCTRCGQVFLQIGPVKIRSARPLVPDYDWHTGMLKTGLCNSPRCARFSPTAEPTGDEE